MRVADFYPIGAETGGYIPLRIATTNRPLGDLVLTARGLLIYMA